MLFGEVIMFTTMVLLYMLAFCRVVIGLVFVMSSVSKVLNHTQFRQAVSNFHILPGRLSGVAAVLFLCGEFAVVVSVVIGGTFLLPGFYLAIFLLLLFCFALISVLHRHIRTSCNCFGSKNNSVSATDVLRNIGLITCACIGCGILVASHQVRGHLSLVEWGLLGLAATLFVTLWLHLREIVQVFQQS
jgi:uncharacterized membrane protein YphA (DoxX/SURF4 family)